MFSKSACALAFSLIGFHAKAESAGTLAMRCQEFEIHLRIVGNQFLYDTTPGASFCAGFFGGFDALGGLMDAPAQGRSMERNLGICAYGGLRTTEAEAIFARYMRAHPERQSDPAMDVVTDAVRAAHPCSAANGSQAGEVESRLKKDVEKHPVGLTHDCRKLSEDHDRLSC